MSSFKQNSNNWKSQKDLTAEEIKERVNLAYLVAGAEYGFEPVSLRPYYLYKSDDKLILTLISPDEWNSPYSEFVAKVRKLGDSTWEKIIEENEKNDNRSSRAR